MWQSALLYPERFTAVIGMSVIYGGRAQELPLVKLRQDPDEEFFYTNYFQTPGVAEAEFDANPRQLVGRLYTSRSRGTPTFPPEVTDTRASAGGWLPRLASANRFDYRTGSARKTWTTTPPSLQRRVLPVASTTTATAHATGISPPPWLARRSRSLRCFSWEISTLSTEARPATNSLRACNPTTKTCEMSSFYPASSIEYNNRLQRKPIESCWSFLLPSTLHGSDYTHAADIGTRVPYVSYSVSCYSAARRLLYACCYRLAISVASRSGARMRSAIDAAVEVVCGYGLRSARQSAGFP